MIQVCRVLHHLQLLARRRTVAVARLSMKRHAATAATQREPGVQRSRPAEVDAAA